LTTSRQPLGIAGEHTFRVPSLSVPPAEAATPEDVRAYEAAQLLVARARQQRPGFEVTAANAPALAAICRQLDGIPLALELAAPRVRSMSVEEVSARLARTFKVLSAGSPTALPRQRTLRSLIDWSYDLLTEQEQALLCRLSVFAGGFLPEAAEHACSGEGIDTEDVLEMLSSLCDKSLVVADEHDSITRYRLLETVRQYGHERLVQQGDEDRWRERHFRYVLAFASETAPLLVGPDQRAWLARLDTEHDNLRAALAWSAHGGGDPLAGLELAHAIQDFWWLRQHLTEASIWLGELLAATRDTPASVLKGRVMTFHGVILWQQGNFAAARTLHEQSADMGRALGDRSLVASALGNLAFVLTGEGDYAGARTLQEEILAMRRAEGDPRRIATALCNLAVGCRCLGDHASARALLEEGLGISRTLGHGPTLVTALQNLAIVALDQDDLTAALALGTECLVTARELGDRRIEAMALNLVGGVLCRQGDLEQGEAYLRQSLATHDPGAVSDMTEVCDTLATACRKVKPVRAARIWGGVERIRSESGHRKLPLNERNYVLHVAEAREALADDAAFDAAWQEGHALSLDEMVAYALGDG
jgi:non-specific serine/threonine protein kinase